VIFLLLAAGLGVTIRLLIGEREKRELTQHQREAYRLEGLGISQYANDNWAEAESSLREAFTIRHRFLHNEPPNSLVAALFIKSLQKQNKGSEAFTELFSFSNGLFSISELTPLLDDSLSEMGSKGRWNDAAKNAMRLVKSHPERSEYYHTLAPVLVALGDISE